MGLAKERSTPIKEDIPHLQEIAPSKDVAWEAEVGMNGSLAFREAQNSVPCGKDDLSHRLIQRLGKPAGQGSFGI